MAQIPKLIDITATFVPVDPSTFPQNYLGTGKQDEPYRTSPVIPYEGWNFLPTSYGYKSYFGMNSMLSSHPLVAARLDKVFIVGTEQYSNYLIALTSTGIFACEGGTNDPWVQKVVLTDPHPLHREWTVTVLSNEVYMYRQGEDHYWKIEEDYSGIIIAVTPTFLNMAGQRGIFKAGNRLGFWDSEGSIAWSSLDDYSDLTPDVKTLAGSAIFNDVVGPIVTVQSMADGFIIYSTNSIIAIERDLSGTFQWNPRTILRGNGIAYSDQVIVENPDTTHYAYTGIGLFKIEGGAANPIATDFVDLLKESQYPISLRLLENRYLAFQMIDARMIEGQVDYQQVTVPGTQYVFPSNLSIYDIPQTFSDNQVSTVYSFGGFIEQQVLFEEARVQGGWPLKEPGTLAKPIWTYYYRSREPWPAWPAHPSSVDTLGYCQGRTVYNSVLVGTSSLQQEATEDFLYTFMYTQKSMWNAAEEAAEAWAQANVDYYTQYIGESTVPPNPAFPYDGAILATQNLDISFIFNPCSISASCTVNQGQYVEVTVDTGPPPGYGHLLDAQKKTMGLLDTGSTVEAYPKYESSASIIAWKYKPILGGEITIPAGTCYKNEGITDGITPDIDAEADSYIPIDWSLDPLDIPAGQFQLSDGSPGPYYPTYVGAVIYDMQYKKWGKLKAEYVQLLDLSPINTNQGKIVTTQRFGINAAAVTQSSGTNYILRFDAKPSDSYIKYGKIGYYRLGMTTVEEVKVNFRLPCTGAIEVRGSLGGRFEEDNQGLLHIQEYSQAYEAVSYPSMSSRWHSITLRGNFDITHLEYRGYVAGRR